MNSSDKLWELKKLKHKRDDILFIAPFIESCELERRMTGINSQISKLLEDD